MDGKVVSVEEIEKLAKLPSREMLLTQLATVLLANIRNLAVVLDQTREKLEENRRTSLRDRLNKLKRNE